MSLPAFQLVVSIAVALSVCASAAGQAPGAVAEPLATRQNFFTIPFTVPNPASAAEVHLYVSADQGRTWQLYARELPQAGKFQFRAHGDGEYWFASRTVAPHGHPQPPAPQQPELRVLIDTVSPHLDLAAEIGPSGEVHTAWEIADANLVASSFKIFFRHDAADPWQPVAVELPQSSPRDRLSGRTAWWPQRHGGTLQVRAEVQDRAGNTNVVQRSLQLPSLVDLNSPHSQPPLESRFVNNPVQWPADGVAGEHSPPSQVRPRDEASARHEFRPRPREPASQPQSPPLAPFDLPPGERPHMTRQRQFNLDYDISGVGPSGVARVELWATRDGGRLWEMWGVDEDRRSPMPVEVDGEGVYGFRIVVQSGNGLVGRRPRSGDPAEVWIGVDETPPQARILSAQYGRGQQVGTLTIFWEASDAALHPRPVTLLQSGRPDGPWNTIAAGLPNTGRYDWRVDDRVPANIYVRLEVRDEAGNLAVHQLDTPIANDGLIPRGRIRGVHSP